VYSTIALTWGRKPAGGFASSVRRGLRDIANLKAAAGRVFLAEARAVLARVDAAELALSER